MFCHRVVAARPLSSDGLGLKLTLLPGATGLGGKAARLTQKQGPDCRQVPSPFQTLGRPHTSSGSQMHPSFYLGVPSHEGLLGTTEQILSCQVFLSQLLSQFAGF